MATTILLIILGSLAITAIPLIASVHHYNLHKTDLMAGDEGED